MGSFLQSPLAMRSRSKPRSSGNCSRDELTRRLGYKEVAGHVFPVKPVSVRKSLPSGTLDTGSQPQIESAFVRDMLNRRAAESYPSADWVAWRPPQVQLPAGLGRPVKTAFVRTLLRPTTIVRGV